MFNDDVFFGYTIEPPHVTKAGVDDISALPEGTYALVLRANPMAGTPCIKLIGMNVPANASIRCCNSQSVKNPSITLVSEESNSGSYKETDVNAWTKLLNFLIKNKSVSLVIM